jgi:hypothetical protein
MKRVLFAGVAGAAALSSAHAQGLYYSGDENKESLPLKWIVGADVVFDDNVNPTAIGVGSGESGTSINPYVGVTFISISPQTTWDVYARLGLVYYFDQPSTLQDDVYTQSRVGVDFTHNFSERLRFSSRNFIAYELEPDYSYGFATSRQTGEYFYWQTDNSLGYRWTERFATYTGIQLTGLDYDSSVPNSDRLTWQPYLQGRYQLSPQTVLTGDYRFAQTTGDGAASDATDHYLLAGVEHRFSATTILIARAGAQFHEVDSAGSDNSVSPYVELALNSQINTRFSVRSFLRYGLENYDTVRAVPNTVLPPALTYEFDSRETLRLGVAGEYAISPRFSLFGGLDYIPSNFEDGRLVNPPAVPIPGVPVTAGGYSEDIFNGYIGLSVKFNDYLYGTLSYNHTTSSSDLLGGDYDRNRVSVGLRAEF